jgi:hypothetical protein
MHEIFIWAAFYSAKWNCAKSPDMLLSACTYEFLKTYDRICPFRGQNAGLLLTSILDIITWEEIFR